MPNKTSAEIGVYGLNSCDSCRKARKWLQASQYSFQFHDMRVDGLDGKVLDQWLGSDFAAQLLNQRSTTWRQLSAEEKASATSSPKQLLLKYPALIKRPVFTRDRQVLAVGFEPQDLESALQT